MRTEFNFSEATELMQSLNHYKQLINYFPQLDPKQKESLDSIWKEEGKYEGSYYNSPTVQYWNRIEIHIVGQMWGSTSRGWGGVGGAAMTNGYNYIIHQKYTDLYYVYWDGKLAYIVKASDILKLDRLPGLYSNSAKEINFVYKNFKEH